LATVPHDQVMLDALAHELAEHPERLVPVDAALIEQLQTLVAGVEVDLDQLLSPDPDDVELP
jgi:antitoxin PrlF